MRREFGIGMWLELSRILTLLHSGNDQKPGFDLVIYVGFVPALHDQNFPKTNFPEFRRGTWEVSDAELFKSWYHVWYHLDVPNVNNTRCLPVSQ